jgi:putative intracellular protease/amidase
MVLTSHDQLGDTGRKTGFWLEELAAPYYVFRDAGVDITLVSPKGGQPPIKLLESFIAQKKADRPRLPCTGRVAAPCQESGRNPVRLGQARHGLHEQ